jgi:uncharacterized membrane protein YfcA
VSELLGALSLAELSYYIIVVVFAASMMQSITGIGFGVIAGPVLLVSIGGAEAIQVSIVLSLLIAVILAPSTIPRVNFSLLRPLLIGVLLGTPIGATAYATLSLDALKIVAALVVAFMTLIASGLLTRHPIFEEDTRKRRVAIGMVCGALNVTLAMPGPPVAAYATAIKSDKQIIRATTLVTFLFAYPVALSLQGVTTGFSSALFSVALPLAIPTVFGTITGMLVAPLFSQKVFNWLTVVFLIASVMVLVVG